MGAVLLSSDLFVGWITTKSNPHTVARFMKDFVGDKCVFLWSVESQQKVLYNVLECNLAREKLSTLAKYL